jgi:hypothetical protein
VLSFWDESMGEEAGSAPSSVKRKASGASRPM